MALDLLVVPDVGSSLGDSVAPRRACITVHEQQAARLEPLGDDLRWILPLDLNPHRVDPSPDSSLIEFLTEFRKCTTAETRRGVDQLDSTIRRKNGWDCRSVLGFGLFEQFAQQWRQRRDVVADDRPDDVVVYAEIAVNDLIARPDESTL